MARKRGDNERFEDGLGLLMGALDWQSAMEYAKFGFGDIKRVILAVEGEPDGDDWRLVVELKNGRFGWLVAGCDYSGWGCQDSWSSGTCKSKARAVKRSERR